MSIDTSPAAASAVPEQADPVTQAYLDATLRLEGFAEIDPESLDGFLTALACAPEPLPFSDALVELAGDDYERCFADPADRAAADEAFRRYHERIVEQLEPEALEAGGPGVGLRPYMHAFDDAVRAEARAKGISDEDLRVLYDGAAWASGFVDGLAFSFEKIKPPLAPKTQVAMRDCMAHVSAMGLGDGADYEAHVRRWWKARRPSRDELVDTAIGAVEDLRLFWLEDSLTPAPLVSDKVGRNDPCPCGSGKKFKKCHGAAAA